MWQAEASIQKIEQRQEALKGEIKELQMSAEVGDKETMEKIDGLKNQIADLEREKAAVLAQDKNISDGLPQREKTPARDNRQMIYGRYLDRGR
jgi:chromosome segregation ATPase